MAELWVAFKSAVPAIWVREWILGSSPRMATY